MCPILREPDGLAMSSRNIHLSAEDRQHALILSRTLNWFGKNLNRKDITSSLREGREMISSEPGVQLEYFEAVDENNLHPADENTSDIVVLVAAKVGNTRLIDNLDFGLLYRENTG